MPEFSKYYDLESYLFDEVSPRFANAQQLSVFDFFCIVIWKANRSKSKVADRLLARCASLCEAVAKLIAAVAECKTDKDRMRVLLADWGFRLPMASAILTVMYPAQFTVYDVRVCGQLGKYKTAQYGTNFEALWTEYDAYRSAVEATRPGTLRQNDRWLWGKSFHDQLQSDIQDNFSRVEPESEVE